MTTQFTTFSTDFIVTAHHASRDPQYGCVDRQFKVTRTPEGKFYVSAEGFGCSRDYECHGDPRSAIHQFLSEHACHVTKITAEPLAKRLRDGDDTSTFRRSPSDNY